MKQPIQRVANLIKVLAHPGRLKVIKLLGEQGPLSVTSLLTQLNTEQSLMSNNLGKMRKIGLLIGERRGKEIFYELSDPSITDVLRIMLNNSSAVKS